MILCVDSKKLRESFVVQKDKDVIDRVFQNVRYFDNAEEAEKEFFVPIDFCVSIRTTYSNLVLKIVQDGKDLYYVNQTRVGMFSHKGLDLVMYLAAIGLMSCVDYSYAFDDMMLKYSQIQFIGLYNPDSGFINPIMYSHIIIADEAVAQLQTLLKKGVELVPLSYMRTHKRDNLAALIDTLIDVEKGENENGNDDH